MDDEILTTFCICDDLLKAFNHKDHPQAVMSNSEIMLVAIVAVQNFGGNFALACRWLNRPEWVPKMIGPSRLNRRLHQLKNFFLILFSLQSVVWKEENPRDIFSIDTFPIPVCDNIRISRCKIYQNEAYRGYKASKRRYFYGLKLHLLISESGKPIEFFLSPGSVGDVSGLYGFDFDLPDGSLIVADKAYNVYWYEDILKEAGIHLVPIRKSNSKRPSKSWEKGLHHLHRQTIETSGSLISSRFPKSIHAVTAAGFELKIILFILAFSLSFIY